MRRVRFAASPLGTLDVGAALSAVANRAFGDWMLLRIDDTDPARTVEGGVEAILRDLAWLGVDWDDGPVLQSGRRSRHLEAARSLGPRYEGRALLREDESPTPWLAAAVDDIDFGITHVVRGNDRRTTDAIDGRLAEALGARAPEYVRHGRLRADGVTVAALREAGIPAEAVRAYLDALGLPPHDVHLDLPRMRRLGAEAIAALPDDELAARAHAPVELAPALRGARDLVEARAFAAAVLDPEPAELPPHAGPTLERFVELRSRAPDRVSASQARSIVRELKAVGGDLRALRLALTGRSRGPELWAALAALDRDEALARATCSRARAGGRPAADS